MSNDHPAFKLVEVEVEVGVVAVAVVVVAGLEGVCLDIHAWVSELLCSFRSLNVVLDHPHPFVQPVICMHVYLSLLYVFSISASF